MICSEDAKEHATSTIDWQTNLGRLLESSSEECVALIGIGHPLRGDDYVGSYVLKELVKLKVKFKRQNVHLFDAEDNVESIITEVIDSNPKHVIFIDSCEMNVEPGEVHLIPISGTSYPFFTTHGIPLKLLCERMLPQCEAWVLGVQPKQVEFSDTMSPEVSRAGILISRIVKEIVGGK